MDQEKVQHCLEEADNWLVRIRDLRQETSTLRDMLSETVRQGQKFGSLDQAEYFQQRFMEKDQVLDLFRQDISILKQSLLAADDPDAAIARFFALKGDLGKLTGEMQRLRDAFYDFLSADKGY